MLVAARLRSRPRRHRRWAPSSASTERGCSPGSHRCATGSTGSVPGGARVDGRLLVAGVLAAVERLGGTVRTATAALRRGAGTVMAVVDDRELAGDRLVVAGGAWSTSILGTLDVTVDVEPQRGQITHLRLDGVDTSAWPTVVPVGDHYLVAFDDGRIVAGATRETGSGFDVRTTAAGQRQVLDEALALAPGLATASVLETRVGLRPLATAARRPSGPCPVSTACTSPRATARPA